MVERKSMVDAADNIGKKQVGGAIFEVSLDTTHPTGFGYPDAIIPVNKNNMFGFAQQKRLRDGSQVHRISPH